jgi:hypothetical protein
MHRRYQALQVLCAVLLAQVFSVPNASAIDDALLGQISGIFEEAWNEPPFQAARGLCVQGWGLMAALGDEKAHQRLSQLARAIGEDYRAEAVKSLLQAGDRSIYDDLMRVAVDPKKPREERLAALGIGTWWVHDPIPAEAERLACDEAANPNAAKGMYEILRKHATEQSRVPIEAALTRALRGKGHSEGSLVDDRRRFRNAGEFPQEDRNRCLVGWCMAALRRTYLLSTL